MEQDEGDIRRDEREKCWREITERIKSGPLPGNGTDKMAERNGLVMAANIILDHDRGASDEFFVILYTAMKKYNLLESTEKEKVIRTLREIFRPHRPEAV